MPYQDILFVCADAGVALLKSLSLTTIPPDQIYAGVRHDEIMANLAKEISTRKTPRIDVIARHADPVTSGYCGTWIVALTFRVVSNISDTTAAQHRQRVEETFTQLLSGDIAGQLSGASEFLYCPVVVPSARETSFEGKLIVDELGLELRHACVDKTVLASLGTTILGSQAFGS